MSKNKNNQKKQTGELSQSSNKNIGTLLQIITTVILFFINLNFTKYSKQLNELNYISNINNKPLQFDINDSIVVDTKNRFCHYNKDAPRKDKQELNYDIKIKFLQGQISDAYMVNLSNDKYIVEKINNIDIDNENKTINLDIKFNHNNYKECRLETDVKSDKYIGDYFKVSDTVPLYFRFIDYEGRCKEYLIIILPPIDALQDTMDFAKKYYNYNFNYYNSYITNNGYVQLQYKIIDLSFFTEDTLEKEIDSLTYILPNAIDYKKSKETYWRNYNIHPTTFSCYEYTKPDYRTIYEKIKEIQSIGTEK